MTIEDGADDVWTVPAALRSVGDPRVLGVIGAPKNLRLRHNIALTTAIDVVLRGESGRELASMRWGLVPFSWLEQSQDVPTTFNAPAEAVAKNRGSSVPSRS